MIRASTAATLGAGTALVSDIAGAIVVALGVAFVALTLLATSTANGGENNG